MAIFLTIFVSSTSIFLTGLIAYLVRYLAKFTNQVTHTHTLNNNTSNSDLQNPKEVWSKNKIPIDPHKLQTSSHNPTTHINTHTHIHTEFGVIKINEWRLNGQTNRSEECCAVRFIFVNSPYVVCYDKLMRCDAVFTHAIMWFCHIIEWVRSESHDDHIILAWFLSFVSGYEMRVSSGTQDLLKSSGSHSWCRTRNCRKRIICTAGSTSKFNPHTQGASEGACHGIFF